MKKLTKMLLVISLLCLLGGFPFASGLVKGQYAVGLYAVLPTGAVFLGLFLICLLFEKEMAQYDADQRAPSAPAAPAGKGTASVSEKPTHS